MSRATGIPTIQDELKANGSPKATIETDEERTYFLMDIPCHPEFVEETLTLDKDVMKELSERQIDILIMIAEDNTLTSQKITQGTARENAADDSRNA